MRLFLLFLNIRSEREVMDLSVKNAYGARRISGGRGDSSHVMIGAEIKSFAVCAQNDR